MSKRLDEMPAMAVQREMIHFGYVLSISSGNFSGYDNLICEPEKFNTSDFLSEKILRKGHFVEKRFL